MKIIAKIPTEEIRKDGWLTHLHERFEVVVLRIRRYETGRNTKRFYYHVDVLPPKKLLKLCEIETSSFLLKEDEIIGKHYSTTIDRKLNKKWLPPKENWVEDRILIENL